MKTNHGFTLFELLIYLSLAVILLSYALPNCQWLLQKHAVTADTQLILRTVAKSRELSIHSGRKHSVCGVNANNKCSRTDIVGLKIFEDQNNNRTYEEHESSIIDILLSGKNNIYLKASGNSRAITFNSDAYARQFGSFYICPTNPEYDFFQRVSINRSGRAYQAVDRNGDGQVEMANGRELICEY